MKNPLITFITVKKIDLDLSHHCSSCNTQRPLNDFYGIGEQPAPKGGVFGYLINCKVCGSTAMINKNKDNKYEEKVEKVEKRIRKAGIILSNNQTI